MKEEKLKTLKEIENKPMYESVTRFKPFVYSDDIRAEAVKWVKCEDFDDVDGWDCFKMFFNLTEEDLK